MTTKCPETRLNASVSSASARDSRRARASARVVSVFDTGGMTPYFPSEDHSTDIVVAPFVIGRTPMLLWAERNPTATAGPYCYSETPEEYSFFPIHTRQVLQPSTKDHIGVVDSRDNFS